MDTDKSTEGDSGEAMDTTEEKKDEGDAPAGVI